jgi:redox-regulated HSP33 family molecular chaperone
VSGAEVEATAVRTCHFAFKCDCSPDKLAPFFRSLDDAALDELYGGDTELSITCPRCGRGFSLPRELVRGGAG